MKNISLPNTLAILALIALGLFAYGLTVRGVPGNQFRPEEDIRNVSAGGPFESSHERASYAQLLSLILEKRFDLSRPLADFAAPDVGYFEGRFYSYFPPGVAFLIAPLALLGARWGYAQVLSYSTISIVQIMTLILMFMLARRMLDLSLPGAMLASLVFGFGTIAWSYGITIYQHAPTVFLMMLAMYSAWRYANSAPGRFFWAVLVWAAYGISPLLDYPNLILFAPIMVYFVFSSVRILREEQGLRVRWDAGIALSAFAFLAFIGALFMYDRANFGSFLQTTNTLPRYQVSNISQLKAMDLRAAIIRDYSVSSVFQETNLARGFYTLTLSPDKGLFVFSPILALGLFGIFSMRRRMRPEIWTLLALLAVDFLVYSSFGDPWGGWAFGPRYLMPAVAVLSLFAAVWMDSNARFWSKTLSLFLFAFSSAVATLGAITTDAIPPRVEADAMNIKYGLSYAWQYFRSDNVASFAYKYALSNSLDLQEFYFLLWAVVFLAFSAVLLFVKHLKPNVV